MSVSVETGVELGRSKGNARPSFLTLLFAPDRGMARQALAGRAIGFFLVAWLCSILLGAALAYRVDATDVTLMKLDKSGQLKGMSDRQVADEIKNAERVAVVIDVAKGVTKAPVQLGLSCLAILALTWFLRGKIKGSAVAPVAGAALLPGAIADLLDAGTAFRHAAIPPDGTELAPRTLADVLDLTSHPLMGSLHKLGDAFDFLLALVGGDDRFRARRRGAAPAAPGLGRYDGRLGLLPAPDPRRGWRRSGRRLRRGIGRSLRKEMR